ncbi:type I restriction enzyme HsdR N-terminal domain-containing protein [Chryseobacterium sp. AG363]|uniref:type I restriction enzyme HsdR N-terminal domain-containing protein n=1 Tax=Chryseobacterium sp. AG363 TaxID=2183997 RepID=UPI000E7246FF|nr:type I restriction enzyme HsdR N-terminal domain-containing protein [Chryseobacterium sp. AG363]RKE80869.1 type I restriction and modification enzyme subunit R-like protein [Chryseobacterium sp. AG363]
MNEEEIRGKLLLPFLKDLGFDESEISLERNFKIRLGKTVRPINGRSDILCKRNGQNLFIVELKNDSILIDQNDIEQGISYARALEGNIAPFTIITSGKDTKIFDSVSKEELTGKNISEYSEFFKNGYSLSMDEDLRIRYEALAKFISFSSENLRLFCKGQVQDRMGPIMGSKDSPSAKFISELYCEREDLFAHFNNFLNSDAKIYAIVGAAGVGKTNSVCSLALQSLEDKFVFFYNAALLHKSPLEHIAQDLNVVFSGKSDSMLVLKKLNELGRSINKTVLIFIDAIDESTNQNISYELSEIALSCRNFDNVKICISCKLTIWDSILKINGTKSHLHEELEKYPEITNHPLHKTGFLLQDFTELDLINVIPKYESIFGFKGPISKSLLEELKNGFFLKIFSQVYKGKEVPEKINDIKLIRTYLQESLEKTEIGIQPALRILSKIGKVLLNSKYTSRESRDDNGIDINNVLTGLKLGVNEGLSEDLFARNILIRSNKEDSFNISFYFSKIRDYVICFHSYKLNKLSDDEFYGLLEKFYQNYIGQSALAFYMENASFSHRRTLSKFKKDKAIKYVKKYNKYLDKHFKNTKALFDPKTNGEIGIILSNDELHENGYALYQMQKESSDKIRLEDLKDSFTEDNYDYLLNLGVNCVHGSNQEFLVADQQKILKQNILKQLKELLKKGRLPGYSSDILLLEQVSLIIYYYHKKLNYDYKIDDYYIPRFEQIYPINLTELKDKIYLFKVFYHFRNREGLFAEDLDIAVEKALRENFIAPDLHTVGDFPPFEELGKIVDILLERGYSIIENHHLPLPDKSVFEAQEFEKSAKGRNYNQLRVYQFSQSQAKLYTESFFNHVESCYKSFVEENFPAYKKEFQFYNNCPHEYFIYCDKDGLRGRGFFGYKPSKQGRVGVHISKIPAEEVFRSKSAHKEADISVLRVFSFGNFIYNDNLLNHRQTFYEFRTPEVDKFCVLRNWVYRLVEDDIEKVFKNYDV